MQRRVVHTDKVPPAAVPLSQAIKVGAWVFASGQLAMDPKTGETSFVFSCFNQDQLLDQVDFGALAQRLAQNGVQEKLTALWIGRCLKQLPPPAERKAA